MTPQPTPRGTDMANLSERRADLLARMEAARDAVCIRAFPDGYRLFDGDTRLEGPWGDADLSLAREARDRAQLDAMLSAVIGPILDRLTVEGLAGVIGTVPTQRIAPMTVNRFLSRGELVAIAQALLTYITGETHD